MSGRFLGKYAAMKSLARAIVINGVLIATASRLLFAQAATTSGKFTVERPTLVSLGFEWRIVGDDNSNAKVEVTYREAGEKRWHTALPLMRLHNEIVVGSVYVSSPINPNTPLSPEQTADYKAAQAAVTYVSPNMFAGSILNLVPDTEYECHFVLSDPDGVRGKKETTVSVRTRKEPIPAQGGHVYHVYPVGYTGPRKEPSFTGLMAAYYYRAPHIDWENAYPPRVKAGDTILVHAGLYVGDRFHYMNGAPHAGYLALGDLFDGTYYLTASGTPDKPIVIKSASDGEVIFDGAGCQYLFNLLAANYNYFEGITIRNANVAFLLGLKNTVGASGFSLKHSRIYNVGRVVQDDWSGSKDFYIADNIFVGRHDPSKMMSWSGAVWAKYPGFPELIVSEYAIKLYGQGHVVAYNYFSNWHDGLDIATYGVPDGTPKEIPDRVPVSIDFYNNDFYNMGDNCMESDGGAHNIRLFRNRCFNSPGGALSAQPMWGGPLYVYQNLVYNTPTFGSCKYAPASGILTYQNTFVGECRAGTASNMHFLNNLILAEGASEFDGNPMPYVFSITTLTNYTTSDYNGFSFTPGSEDAFEWNSPNFNVASDYDPRTIRHREFKTLKEYQDATGQERHSRLVDFNVFVNVKKPDPNDPQHLYNPEDYDFRLRPGSAAVDAGVVLPTINDEYTGKAPDLGAFETGTPRLHYGPRTPVPGTVPQNKQQFRSWTGPPTSDNSESASPKGSSRSE